MGSCTHAGRTWGMRPFLAIAVLALAAGCTERGDEPTGTSAAPATPEDACAARGIAPVSCDVFCELNAAACGLPEPAPMPYPSVPLVTPPAGMPAFNASTGAPTVPDVCALLPTLPECPQL